MGLSRDDIIKTRRAWRSLVYALDGIDAYGNDGAPVDVDRAAGDLIDGLKNASPDDRWSWLSQAALLLNRPEYRKQYERLSNALDDSQLKGLFGHDGDDLRRSLIGDIGTSRLAFDDNACEFVDVTVDGVPAVYIHSAFTTRVPLSVLMGWLDPAQWPERAPIMFEHVTSLLTGTPHERAGYSIRVDVVQEEATPTWDIVHNTLVCGRAQYGGGGFAITSYDLDPRGANEVLVDRGYLLAAERGDDERTVGFVKIIGFEKREDNETVKKLRPFWLHVTRAIAEGSRTTNSQGAKLAGDAPDDRAGFGGGDLTRQWIDAATGSITEFGALAGNLVERFTGPTFGWSDYRDVVSTYWQTVGARYAKAWTTSQEIIDEMGGRDTASPGLLRTLSRSGPRVATSAVPVPSVTGPTAATVGPMYHIADPTARPIPPRQIRANVVVAERRPELQLEVDTRGTSPGVYVGRARVGASQVPVFVFVSAAALVDDGR